VCDFSYYRRKYPRDWDVPVARHICESTITLPVGPHLKLTDITLIADEFCKAVEKV
jgi:dTDP-4-amino-4,6-dideoxygalactose transaminase